MRAPRPDSVSIGLLFASVSVWLLSCGECHTTTAEVCQSLGTVTITAPAEFTVACAPTVGWSTLGARASLWLERGCATDSMYMVYVELPKDGGPAMYTQPSPDAQFGALFQSSSGEWLSTSPGPLALTWGMLVVQDRGVDFIEGDLDIEIDTKAGERISVAGHVLETKCRVEQGETCHR